MWPALRAYLSLGVLVTVLVGPLAGGRATAFAQGGTAAPASPVRAAAVKKAREHFEKGQRLFTVSRYREALEEFKEGFVAVEDPVFLFNIAQSHRLLGENGEAVRFYRRFIEVSPSAAERARAQKWIAELEAAGPGPAAAVTPPAAVSPPPAGVSGPTQGRPGAPPPQPARPGSSAAVSAPSAAPVGARPASSPALAPPPVGALAVAPGAVEPPPAPTDPVVTLNQVPPAPEPARPIYKKWWFWAGAGAVVVLGGIVAASAAGGGGETKCGVPVVSCTRL